MVEGLTVEELARLKAEAEGYQIGARPGSAQYKIGRDFLALITQVERLTAERDEQIGMYDEGLAAYRSMEARADTLAAENERLSKIEKAAAFLASAENRAVERLALERLRAALAAGEPAR